MHFHRLKQGVGCFVQGGRNGMGCFVQGSKNGMGYFVRGDKNCMGCLVHPSCKRSRKSEYGGWMGV